MATTGAGCQVSMLLLQARSCPEDPIPTGSNVLNPWPEHSRPCRHSQATHDLGLVDQTPILVHCPNPVPIKWYQSPLIGPKRGGLPPPIQHPPSPSQPPPSPLSQFPPLSSLNSPPLRHHHYTNPLQMDLQLHYDQTSATFQELRETMEQMCSQNSTLRSELLNELLQPRIGSKRPVDPSCHLESSSLPQASIHPPVRFADLLVRQFGSDNRIDYQASLAKLQQMRGVTDYKSQFTKLSCRALGFSQEVLLACFVGGLEEEIRVDVRALRPRTLLEVYELDKIYEERHLGHCWKLMN
ncbi:hypothetical protein M0R45_005533 [Rubus argutus]|uniref:Retrotransposon gag domain-containing protein n=1 Tax=Rubus argutus TaxID=59490 RepID=A0AAW1YMX5_RUBAR